MSIQVGQYTYQANDLLGIGPYGKVYKGRDKLGRYVAIKIVSQELIQDSVAMQESLIEELGTMKVVHHTKLLKFIDAIRTDNNYYLISEYSSGVDVAKLLIDKHKMDEEMVIQMIQDILEAFIELIQHGIMHRDIKPTNIIYEDGVFKLCDFGFAHCMDNFIKQDVQLIGGELYKSPQILTDHDYSSLCDIWSIGILCYVCLYGYTPWFAKLKKDLIHDIHHQPIVLNPNIHRTSDKLEQFIRGCLEIEEKDRLTWDQVFVCPLLRDHFNKYQSKIFEDKIKYLMNRIRRTIMREKIDIIELFISLDTSKNNSLDLQEFGNLIKSIDPKLPNNDIEYMFNKVDVDQSRQISFEEFTSWLTKHNVNIELLSTRYKGYKHDQPGIQIPLQLLPQTQTVALNTKTTNNTNQYAQQILENIKQSIYQKYLNMLDIFQFYDKDGDSFLSLYEFQQFLHDMDARIQNEIVFEIFQRFDQDHEGKISFIQFRQLLIIQVISQQQHGFQSPRSQNNLTSQFRYLNKQIIDSKHNMLDLFTQYDRDNDNMLSYIEFHAMMAYLNINNEVIEQLFTAIDDQHQQAISFIQFRTAITINNI